MTLLGQKTDKIGQEALNVAKQYKDKHARMVNSTEAKEKVINEKMGALEKHVDKVELVNERRLEEIESQATQISDLQKELEKAKQDLLTNQEQARQELKE